MCCIIKDVCAVETCAELECDVKTFAGKNLEVHDGVTIQLKVLDVVDDTHLVIVVRRLEVSIRLDTLGTLRPEDIELGDGDRTIQLRSIAGRELHGIDTCGVVSNVVLNVVEIVAGDADFAAIA